MANAKEKSKSKPNSNDEEITNDLYMPFETALKKISVVKKESLTGSFIPPDKKKKH